jgi:transcriptional regulator with XRE-family HTH domain
MSNFADLIKNARQAKGWTQRELARKLCVSQQTINHWEAGGIPRGNRIAQIGDVLNVNLIASSDIPMPPPVYIPAIKMNNMELRDYFAAQVLITACEDFSPAEAARLAYDYADAMLETRK